MNKKQYLKYLNNMFELYNKYKSKNDYNFAQDEFCYFFTQGLNNQDFDAIADDYIQNTDCSIEENSFPLIVQTLVAGYDQHQKLNKNLN